MRAARSPTRSSPARKRTSFRDDRMRWRGLTPWAVASRLARTTPMGSARRDVPRTSPAHVHSCRRVVHVEYAGQTRVGSGATAALRTAAVALGTIALAHADSCSARRFCPNAPVGQCATSWTSTPNLHLAMPCANVRRDREASCGNPWRVGPSGGPGKRVVAGAKHLPERIAARTRTPLTPSVRLARGSSDMRRYVAVRGRPGALVRPTMAPAAAVRLTGHRGRRPAERPHGPTPTLDWSRG